jgi:rRNA pseudouridine-1189 N-methylase Emg1 (Nep1/Mra1 family)
VLEILCQSDKIILRIDTDGRIEKQQFNFNDAVQQLLSGKNINGKDGILAPLSCFGSRTRFSYNSRCIFWK